MKLDLGKENINKLIWSFSIPCVISMLINSIYNIIDQIFIGKGVGSLGNAATNVIFPLIIIFNAVASLIGNGASANMSLKLGEGNKKEAAKSIGSTVSLTIISAIVLAFLSYIFMPKLVYFFGCTESVYNYAVDYGKIIAIGAPFMLTYSSLSNIIRADGSPKYSMFMLIIGAVVNIILDPIFIFVFKMGVSGGAIATVIGQVISFIIALFYLKKVKSVKLRKSDFKIDKTLFKVLSLGLSSFITQMTILALFVFMNNVLTKFGVSSKFGADIPLSVYGVMSKINSLFISTVLGISLGAQPIIGFNYGAGNEARVKETLKKVLIINFVVGIIFNIIFLLFPENIASIFISSSDDSYELFLEFAVLICRTFLVVCSLNAIEMTSSIVIQSLGKMKKATALSFIRQIILFMPIALFVSIVLNRGIYGVLLAGAIADVISFIIAIFIFASEYNKLDRKKEDVEKISYEAEYVSTNFSKVITVSREYGSGGRYVAKVLADRLGIPVYDVELIHLTAKESGFTVDFVRENDEKKNNYYENDDRMFIAETKVIKALAKEPCIIVGRCADYILRNQKNVIKIFLYSDDNSKINRVVKYYGIKKEKAKKSIDKVNKMRSKHYKYYTDRDWRELSNYDFLLNVDINGIEGTVQNIIDIINRKK